ncbi:uncharacterized protein [Elaeis guineensis]|uniref:Nuclear transcription factor Y subunit B-3-like isoform X2 n=1 Tax=Elaeis guineensis var. tenera TaxID=51953 RepID=A0A6I9SHS2_ELAGV|nr:nuclear transcription factor Y subunit B-3-like isoform X2 [Elaeis guineensis]
MAGGGDANPVFPRLPRISSGTAWPFADGINASQTGPAGVLQAGSAAGTTVSPGGAATVPAAQPPVNLRGQEHFMPIANVIRIMRMILPMHAKISDDAKVTILECVSEYISFITGEANQRCQREQRKTIAAEDVIWAMGKLGFDDYVGPLRRYLQRYREIEGDHRIGLQGGDHFPIVKQRRHPQNTAAPSVCSQPPLMCSSMPRLLPSSSLMMPPTAPPLRFNHLCGEGSGSGYFLGMYGGDDGAGASDSQAPPMADFFP